MNVFDWDEFFIWVISWFICWSFSWYAPLTGTLRGTAAGVYFLNISARDISASLCAFPSLTIGLAGAGLYSAEIKSCAACVIRPMY